MGSKQFLISGSGIIRIFSNEMHSHLSYDDLRSLRPDDKLSGKVWQDIGKFSLWNIHINEKTNISY